jgi:hypothetical protein
MARETLPALRSQQNTSALPTARQSLEVVLRLLCTTWDLARFLVGEAEQVSARAIDDKFVKNFASRFDHYEKFPDPFAQQLPELAGKPPLSTLKPPQARDTPDGHHRVEHHRRPQRHAVQSKANAGESEDGNGSDVVKQNRGDQSSSGAA